MNSNIAAATNETIEAEREERRGGQLLAGLGATFAVSHGIDSLGSDLGLVALAIENVRMSDVDP